MCYTNLQLSNCSSTVKKNQRATLSVPQISYQNVWSYRARRSGGPRHLGRARGCRRESYCNARVKQTTAGAVGGCAAAAVSMLRGLRQSAACGGKPGADAGLDDAALGEPAVASRNSVEPRVASRGDAVASRGRAFVSS